MRASEGFPAVDEGPEELHADRMIIGGVGGRSLRGGGRPQGTLYGRGSNRGGADGQEKNQSPTELPTIRRLCGGVRVS